MSYSGKSAPLAAICEVQSGFTARARLDPVAAGGVPAVQLRDVPDADEYDPADLPRYDLTSSLDRYRAYAGDVLFRSRGDKNTAVVVVGARREAPVVVLPLMVLRPDTERVESAYLAWFINQPEAQRHFDKCAQGTRLRVIPKLCLDELAIPLPDLATQHRIVEVDALARREHALLIELAGKKLELTRFALLRQARNAQPHGNEAGRLIARRSDEPTGKSKRTD